MANADSPFGLRPVRHRNGAPYNGAGNVYHVASTDTQVIAPGDPVIVTGTADANGIPTVARATAGATNRITGVMLSLADGAGTVLQDAGVTTTASTSQYILVADDPDLVFHCQASAGLAVTDISSNADLTSAAASGGKSQWEIDSTTYGTGATLQVRVLRLALLPNNAIGTNGIAEVMINLHTNAVGVGSLGI